MLTRVILDEFQRLPERYRRRYRTALKDFSYRLRRHDLTREQNPQDHFCVFFIPYAKKKKQIYLVHHKKAQAWIPPGGHIDVGESPVETLVREMHEELGERPQLGQIRFLGMGWKPITTDGVACKRHWDLWYGVSFPEVREFSVKYDEFYGAAWFSLMEAISMMRDQHERVILSRLLHRY